MDETSIQGFWNSHPCGETFVGGAERYREDYDAFFAEYDRFRYRTEGHILDCLDHIDFKDKQVLEVGLGQGADAEQIIRRGARWSPRIGSRTKTILPCKASPGLSAGSALAPDEVRRASEIRMRRKIFMRCDAS